MIEFCIFGQPCGKHRPRFSYHHCYSEKSDVSYEKTVGFSFLQHRPSDYSLFDKPLSICILACFELPKKPKYPYPQKKPDADNIAKIIMDGLNGVAYRDDQQIIQLTVKKVYSDKPCVIVRLEEYPKKL